jgi:hypothetical protein
MNVLQKDGTRLENKSGQIKLENITGNLLVFFMRRLIEKKKSLINGLRDFK